MRDTFEEFADALGFFVDSKTRFGSTDAKARERLRTAFAAHVETCVADAYRSNGSVRALILDDLDRALPPPIIQGRDGGGENV